MKNVEIKLLNPHPANQDIYGDLDLNKMTDKEKEEFLELVESIKTEGVLEPIVIDQHYTIISGERRYNAVKFLEWEMIPARQYEYEDEIQRLGHLLAANISRVKTNTQLIQEGLVREQLIKDNKKKALEGSNHRAVRDIVGDAIGMSGKSYEVGKEVLKKINSYEDEGNQEEADKLKGKLNKSISGAAKSIKEENKEEVQEEDKGDPDFFYAEKLKSMIGFSEKTLKSIQREIRSNSPTGFTWFLNNIKSDIERYKSWLKPENMHDCPVCKGTMFLKSGDPCSTCIRGKVGTYVIVEKED